MSRSDGGNAARRGGMPALALVPLLALLPVLLYLYVALATEPARPHDAMGDGSCTDESAIERQAVYLVDLRKPLDAMHRSLPGRLLRNVTDDLPAVTELGVYALSPYAEAPRTLIGRLCKTFDNGDLIVETAKDYDGGASDCNDLPAQMSAPVRTSAARFCRQRELIRGRLDALAAAAEPPAAGTPLVEAFEETRDQFDDGVPGTLYVFSDMIQHADWYSHLDLGWDRWDYAELAERRASMPLAEPLRGLGDGASTRIFYVARTGMTTLPERRQAHERFWRDYFGGSDVEFDEQPAMAGYDAERLMELPTAEELASYERERLRHANQIAERLRSELEQERRTLERERQALADERGRLAERERLLAEEAEQRNHEARVGPSGQPAGGEGEAAGGFIESDSATDRTDGRTGA